MGETTGSVSRPAWFAGNCRWAIGIDALFSAPLESSLIANSEVAPKPKDLAEGVSVALICPFLALVLTFPSYLVLAAGLFLRTLGAGRQSST